ncbi:MAG: glycosyltransferase [Ignavibacteria bacterium]|nr:glycosyltransferase [Ignavibacteria bacterium]
MIKSYVKILFIIRQADFGGGETHLRYIFDFVDRSSFVPVLVSFKSGQLSDYAKSLGIEFYCLSSNLSDYLKNLISLIKIIRKEKINFIHAHGTKGALMTLVPAILTKKKMIYTVHSWSFHNELSRFQNLIRKLIEGLICFYSYRVILVSKNDYQLGEFVSPNKKCLIKNGVDTFRFQPFRNEKLRNELNFYENDFVLGYFARFTHQKNPFFVLKLINVLNNGFTKLNKNFKLLMIGDGELKQNIIQYIQENNLSKFIKILEPTAEIENYLNAIDCFVLPSYWEGSPYGILEAMSCGIPVIASNIPSNREIINSGQNGFCLDLDLETFKNTIFRLASDEKLYRNISFEARRTIETDFNIEDSIIELIKIYERLKLHDRS